jgi:hypothetical protein
MLFMPAVDCWFEWSGTEGSMAVMYVSGEDVRRGDAMFYAWRHQDEDGLVAIPLKVDLPKGEIRLNTAMVHTTQPNADIFVLGQALANGNIRLVIFAFLALINSPKIIKRDPARLDRLNKKRVAAGRYTYHPHHVVRLNVDRKLYRVGASDGGDGASRALHFVRAHLRLWNGRYILVSPHWRGDPAVGMRKTSYEIDRRSSRWA